MSATEPLTASIHIEATPHKVFAYFTEPEAIVRWMGEYALLDARPGGEFTVDVRGAPVRGRYLEVDPPHRLVISWGYAGSDALPPGASTVEVRLTSAEGGTLVELEHSGLPATDMPGHAEGWVHYLARLAISATGGTPDEDPGHDAAR